MLRRLKLKFLLLSGISLFVLLAVIIAVVNTINYTTVIREADEILSLLSQNKGTFPGFENDVGEQPQPNPPRGEKDNRLPPHLSPELPYESRYFSVLLNANGEAIYADTGKIATVDHDKAVEYAALAKGEKGFVESFRYVRQHEGDFLRITFLDRGRQLEAFRTFLWTGIGIALCSFLLVFSVIFFCAGRIIRPIAESYEKQKRFITDAGHEIKTPLTVIRANADLLETELGQNECLTDIKQQSERLAALTNDLIYLSRMEEAGSALQMIDFPISEIVQEAAAPFDALALTQSKIFSYTIQPMLSAKGDPKTVEQLVSILMDNAIKYSPEGGKIDLTLSKQGRQLLLTVRNTTATAIDREALPRVFDRFYRTDRSRNSGTGGHGIGLSVAKAIVTAHGGKIHAFADDEHSFGITAVFSV